MTEISVSFEALYTSKDASFTKLIALLTSARDLLYDGSLLNLSTISAGTPENLRTNFCLVLTFMWKGALLVTASWKEEDKTNKKERKKHQLLVMDTSNLAKHKNIHYRCYDD